MLVGPRGVGKTTYLLSQARKNDGIYLPMDNPIARSATLYEMIETAYLSGHDRLYVDEIHYARHWSVELKAAYDAFPDVAIVASDSSAITLRAGLSDLSRRFRIIHAPLMSFREFLHLTEDLTVEPIPFSRVQNADVQDIVGSVNVLKAFSKYRQHGYRPLFLEDGPNSYLDRIANTVTKTIESDIAFLVPSLSEHHLRIMQAVLGYLGSSVVPTLQVNSLCREWGISKNKVYQLIEAMERAHLLRVIRRKHDSSMHTIGAKLLFHEPAFYRYFSDNLGTEREAIVAQATADAGCQVFACRDERSGDFIIDGVNVEVGRATKGAKASDLVLRDDIDLPRGKAVPLWLVCMGY